MGLSRLVMGAARPLIGPASRSAVGRSALLAPLKAQPWNNVAAGGDWRARGFRRVAPLHAHCLLGADAGRPPRLDRITCPVTLVQGVADWVASGQTVRYLPLIRRSRFHPLLWAGHTPQSDRPEPSSAWSKRRRRGRQARQRTSVPPSPNPIGVAEPGPATVVSRLAVLHAAFRTWCAINAPLFSNSWA